MKRWMQWLLFPWSIQKLEADEWIPPARPYGDLLTRDTQCKTVGDLFCISHRIGEKTFVFRYVASRHAEALRKPGIIASRRGLFNYRDAAIVTRAMCRARTLRELTANHAGAK